MPKANNNGYNSGQYRAGLQILTDNTTRSIRGSYVSVRQPILQFRTNETKMRSSLIYNDA